MLADLKRKSEDEAHHPQNWISPGTRGYSWLHRRFGRRKLAGEL